MLNNIEVNDEQVLGPVCLVSVSGHLGSGKDTVGEIIQYLTSYEAISKGSFSHCKEYGLTYSVKWEIKKFAGKLKEIASILTGIDIEKFEDQDFKKTLLGSEWGNIKPIQGDGHINFLMTIRTLLQKLGTDAMRDGLHENVWVNALFSNYRPLIHSDLGGWEYPNWIITDTRFPNELKAVKDRGGITIRVTRPGTDNDNHISETALDDATFDYEIINDRSIGELVIKVREILIKERII